MVAHHDFIGGERDERAARHRVMRHEYRDLRAVRADGPGDLKGGEDEAAGRMQNDVERNIIVGHLNGAEHLFGVVVVDVESDRKAQQPHRLLPMHQQYHARVPQRLELGDLAHSHGQPPCRNIMVKKGMMSPGSKSAWP
jgi:hypothetical protein